MPEDRLIIPHDDETFAAIMEQAAALLALCDAQARTRPHADGEEGYQIQGFHYASAAILNKAGMKPRVAMNALACAMGLAVAEFTDPTGVLSLVTVSAAGYLESALQRQRLTYGEPEGRA